MLFEEFSHFRQNICATKCPDLHNRGGQIAKWAMPKYTRFCLSVASLILDIHKYHQDPNLRYGENIVMMTLCLGSSPTSLVVARLVIHDAEVDAI